MRRLVAAVLLIALPVQAQGFAPSVEPISGGSVTLQEPPGLVLTVPEGWYVTTEGWSKLSTRLTADAKEIARLRAANGFLEQRIKEVASQPGLTVKSVAILVGVGILVGSSTVLLLKK